MDVVETADHLLEQVLRIIFLQLSALTHITQQVATLAKLHDEAHVLARLEGVVQLDDVLVGALLEDAHLLHESPFVLLLVAKNGVLDGLDGHQMLGDLVAGEIDFTESAAAEHPTDTVEIAGAFYHVADLAEIGLYMLFQPLYVIVVLLHLLFLRVH